MSSIFDIFSDQPAKDAAAAQIAGLNAGYGQASGAINQGIGSLNQNYGGAITSLGQNFGVGNNALTSNYGAGMQSLTGNYGAASDALKTNYAAALQPYMQNYGQANAGVTQLGNVLGLNGRGGSDAALTALRNTPGYKFQQQSMDDSVNAAAAANGTLNSGNQLLALNKVNQGLADSTYNNYVGQLQPFLGASNAAAGGVANVNTGLGSSLANTYTGLGNATAGASFGLGNALNSNATGLGTATAGVQTGLGNATAGQYDSLGQLGYQTQTGIGNANANADLAAYNASGNFWNMAQQAGKTAAAFSDSRLKEDIEHVGELYDGQPVYKYRYIGSPVFQIGLMAQDVEKTNPEAVIEIGGYKAVRYDQATQYASDLARFLEAA